MKANNSYQEWKDNIIERRKWERYPPVKGTMALLEGRTYRIMDVSLGGLSIFDYGGETVPEETIVGLHCFEEGLLLDAIKCRKVSDQRVVSHTQYGEVALNRIGLEIVDSDPDLREKLSPFLG